MTPARSDPSKNRSGRPRLFADARLGYWLALAFSVVMSPTFYSGVHAVFGLFDRVAAIESDIKAYKETRETLRAARDRSDAIQNDRLTALENRNR